MAKKTSPYLFPERDDVEHAIRNRSYPDLDDDRPVLGYDTWDVGRGRSAFGAWTGKKCPAHTGATSVYRSLDKTVSLGCAQGHEVDGFAADLVLDLAGVYHGSQSKLIKNGPANWLQLNDLIPKKAPAIAFDWADGSAPYAPIAFWRAMWALLRDAATTTRHIIVCCVGGHGRTGTAVAALILADDLTMTAATATQWVRAHHCASAIETQAQEQYLTALQQQR